ncbi:hypothetical protein BKN38_00855 [Helicobacter sp. CLO-3]|uniref:hypothetical protein n=1 Tax=unclassified Helicobacter TaxID=2593540 RepID=UPI00080530C5|nr:MULTISPECIES: hypothetical protein [unclassified Helicobacter]OBV29633.1 hypothetical protein BA723_04690 [Helicobacter sp. CLO-3]OHU85603.1 hypothetical protein BKN38_00855 [Helicobacter sp. CLO-3]
MKRVLYPNHKAESKYFAHWQIFDFSNPESKNQQTQYVFKSNTPAKFLQKFANTYCVYTKNCYNASIFYKT